MPKIVDHDQRRSDFVEATIRVVIRDGLANTTTRKIAAEAGFANGILAYYFDDKEAIFDLALKRSYEQVSERIADFITAHDGFEALRGAILLALPVEEADRPGIGFEVSLWGRAVGNPELCAHQFESLRQWRLTLRHLVKRAVACGDLRADVDVERSVDVLIALVDGLSLEATLYPSTYGADRLIAVVDAVLNPLRA